MSVPPEFVVKGLSAPQDPKARCKVCDLPYLAHSGDTCGMCRAPVEHHDAESFEVCMAGRRRMARARFLADVPLNDMDRLSLRDG